MKAKKTIDFYYMCLIKSSQKILITQDLDEFYSFVKENDTYQLKAQFYTINSLGNKKILSQTAFLTNFYNSTKNIGKTIMLTELIFRSQTKRSLFLSNNKLNADWLEFQRNKRR